MVRVCRLFDGDSFDFLYFAVFRLGRCRLCHANSLQYFFDGIFVRFIRYRLVFKVGFSAKRHVRSPAACHLHVFHDAYGYVVI